MINQKIPEIYLDHRTVRLLRYIRWHKNCSYLDIVRKFRDESGGYELRNLCRAGYLVARQPDGTYTFFDDAAPQFIQPDTTFWAGSKAREVLDNRFDRLWQWSIPTVISVIALIVSVLS